MATKKEDLEGRVGTTVATKWRIERVLGSGSLAAAYEATHRNGMRAALKIIHRAHCADENVLQRFFQEAHLANKVEHPGVERILDDGTTEDGCAFLVMELLDGRSWERWRNESGGKVSLAEAWNAIDGLLDVVGAIHAAEVLHRNLKPENVFAAADGRTVLLDFGRARLADGSHKSKLSAEGLIIGTPSFMSPEQARGQRSEVDARSDQWSLAACVFTLLTGETVHPGKTSHERLLAAAMKPAREIRTLLPDLDDAVAAVIDRALAFDKKARFESVDEMRGAFRAATGKPAPPARAPVAAATSAPAFGEGAAPAPVEEPARPTADVLHAEVRESEAVVNLPPPLTMFLEAPPEGPPASAPRSHREPPPSSPWKWIGLALVAVIAIGSVVGIVAFAFSDDPPDPPSRQTTP